MVFENIEKLKHEYTDKYVIVDDTRPELQRFAGQTGTVRTVNMSGRALVEFDAYNNIGWFDIDVDFLKIIEQPLEKKDKPEAEAKPAAKEKPKDAKAKKPAAMSAADILAAARGGAAKTKPAAPEKDTGKMSAADVLAAARGGGAAPAKKPESKAPDKPASKKEAKATAQTDPSKMSVADVLAAARGGAAATPKSDDIEVVEDESVVEEVVEQSAEEPPVEQAPAAEASGPLPTAVEDILAFCRERDGG